ncbi:hypothetical protein C8Q80DRAFT_1104637 [Daedaleopsis nitida]|nr:hypothetical protein C8Q80DRAFT_1104637 [Daedaleopsis nitida]
MITSEADAQRILEAHHKRSVVITAFTYIESKAYDAFTPTESYVVRTDDGSSYLLKAAQSAPSSVSVSYGPNALVYEHNIRSLVPSQCDIPIPTIHAFDASRNLVPYHYLLLEHPIGVPLSLALASGKLSARQIAMLELRTGSYLKQLHSRVQNDWFGLPSQASDELYSWQEAFTLLLDGVLDDAHAAGIELPYGTVRTYLSRAIGFFLFDDCDVPSLVCFTADASATYVDIDLQADVPVPGGADAEVRVTAFGSFGHALWGDPLLETLFVNPSAAFIEGYGGPLILFARQKTKRLWYTLFLALVVLVQAKRLGKEDHVKVEWAREAAEKCIASLETAPNY